jgi:hypothetical protein
MHITTVVFCQKWTVPAPAPKVTPVTIEMGGLVFEVREGSE